MSSTSMLLIKSKSEIPNLIFAKFVGVSFLLFIAVGTFLIAVRFLDTKMQGR